MKLLEGKVAVITGAARGIGKAIAIKFASEGANVAFTDLAIDDNAKATEKEIAAMGVKVKGYASNAANFEDTHKVVEEIAKDFGRIDDAHDRGPMGHGHQCKFEVCIQFYPCSNSDYDETTFRKYNQYGFSRWCIRKCWAV